MSWSRVRAEFESLVGQPAAAQEQRLRELEHADAALAARLRTLLEEDRKAADFLERTPGARTATSPVAAGMRIGRFELVLPLGAGGMGTVWEARQSDPSRAVALKIVTRRDPTAAERWRFEHEVRVLAGLSHPAIATFHEAGSAQLGASEVEWLAMELVEGAVDVLTWAKQRTLSREERLDLFGRLCDAVEYGHRRGVLHRDLKPSNVLVSRDGHLKLIDFGIARALGGDAAATGMHTATGEVVGTVHYMAPEQLRGQTSAIGTPSDVYALGVILYHLLCERPPFDFAGLPLASIANVVLEQEPIAPSEARPDLPNDLGWILLRTLEKDPARRYQTVRELTEDLARFRSHAPVHARPPSTAYRLRKFVRRHRVGVAAGAVVAAVSIAAIVTITAALRAERAGRRSAEASLEFLVDVISSPDPGKDGRETKTIDSLERAARDYETRFRGEPQSRAVLSRAIARTFEGLGAFPEAERHFRTSIGIRQECFGPDHEETLGAEAELVGTLLRQGRLQDAEELLTRVEATVAKLPAAAAVGALTPVHRSDLQRARGDGHAAETTLRPLFAKLQATEPRSHTTLHVMCRLAGILHERGDLEAAEPLYRDAVAGLLETKGAEHLDTMMAMQNFAMVLQSRGHFADALPIVERVLGVRQKRLGDAHKDTIASTINVGAIHFRMGHVAEAVRCYDAALAAMGPTPDEKWDVYQVVLSNLAAMERTRHNFPRAIELGERVLAIRQKTLGTTNPPTLGVMAMLGDLYRQGGNPTKAIEVLGECRKLAATVTPPLLAIEYQCELGVGWCHAELGDHAAAERAFLRCLETFDAAERASANKGGLPRADPDLVALYRLTNRPELAAKYESEHSRARPPTPSLEPRK